MIRKLLFLAGLTICIAVLQVGCGSDDDGNGNGPEPVIEPRVVATAHQDPTLANAIDSPVWDSIDVMAVPIGSENEYNANLLYIENKFVEMKALTAGDTVLYIWTQWSDGDVDDRFGQLRATWVQDGVEWAFNSPDDTSESAFNEDRFYMIFDNGGPNGADCAAFCHSAGEESADGRLFYGAGGDNADVWHWKAHRTGLAKLADDMHVTTTRVMSDLGDSMYYRNHAGRMPPDAESFLTEPKYIHEDGILYTGPGLLESDIVNVSGLFEDYDSVTTESNWIIFNDPQPPVGRSVPGYFIYNESGRDGSRWDVDAISEHNGSSWTVVFRRVLTTGDPGDVDFNFSSLDSIQISIGITDNSGVQHFGRRPFYLVFE